MGVWKKDENAKTNPVLCKTFFWGFNLQQHSDNEELAYEKNITEKIMKLESQIKRW